MSKIINGYVIPDGSNYAIILWKALRSILNHPGITLSEIQNDIEAFNPVYSAIDYFALNGHDGPIGVLWNVDHEPTTKFYPNEWTQQAFEACQHPDVCLLEIIRAPILYKYGNKIVDLRPGDLVYIVHNYRWCPAIFTSWVAADIDIVSSPRAQHHQLPHRRTNEFSSFDEIVVTHELTPTYDPPKGLHYSIQRYISINVLFDNRIEEYSVDMVSF
jgi:hypothetical protein